jgi:hypothetical protein
MNAFIDGPRDQGMQMVQERAERIVELDSQHDDSRLTIGVERRLLAAIRSLRSCV